MARSIPPVALAVQDEALASTGVALLWTGSRGWQDKHIVRAAFDTFPGNALSIVGDAQGLDTIVWDCLVERRQPRMRFDANWKEGGGFRKWAGHERNDAMLYWLFCLRLRGWGCSVVAGWDGQSPGTKSMMDKATSFGFPVWRVAYCEGWRYEWV